MVLVGPDQISSTRWLCPHCQGCSLKLEIHESEVILLANVETKLDHHLDPLGVDGLVVLVSLDFSVISSCHLVKNILDALARASPCQFSQIFLAFSSSRTSYV